MTMTQQTPPTRDQIAARLKALNMYEQSVMFTMPDEGEYTTREFERIMIARSKLQEMLKASDGECANGKGTNAR